MHIPSPVYVKARPLLSTGSATNLAVSICAISLAVLGNVISLVVPDSVNS